VWALCSFKGRFLPFSPRAKPYSFRFAIPHRCTSCLRLTAIGSAQLQYDGEWVCGFREGHGSQFYWTGETYHGELVQNKRHGHGRMEYKCGDVYEGQWVRDRKHGTHPKPPCRSAFDVAAFQTPASGPGVGGCVTWCCTVRSSSESRRARTARAERVPPFPGSVAGRVCSNVSPPRRAQL
jgi:hypothetical protein